MVRGGRATDRRSSDRTEHMARGALLAVVLVVVTMAAYWPAMRAGYIWDDVNMVDNPFIKEPGGLRKFWLTTEHTDYWPLTSTSLWLEWRLWGADAKGYHVTNVLLHAASAVLLWLTLKRLKVPGAWLGAMIFAVHPVNVASVAWISERKNTLSMLLYLTTILLYLQHDNTESPRRWRWYILSTAAFLLALLSKTSVVMLPFVLLGCVWWLKGRLSVRDALKTAPFFALSLTASYITVWFQNHRSIGAENIIFPGIPERIAGAGWAIWFYLYKAALPLHQSMIYSLQGIGRASVVAFIPNALLAALFVLLWVKRKSWGKPPLFALGYFVLTLAPVLGFFKMYFARYSLVADHWQYVSLIGVIALAVGLVSHAGGSWSIGRRQAAIGCGVLLVCVLWALTWTASRTYRNEEAVWRHAIPENPEASVAQDGLGIVLASKGYVEAGISLLSKAVRLDPEVGRIHGNYGLALRLAKRMDDSRIELEKAIRLDPNVAIYHRDLGYALHSVGRADESLERYEIAARLDPSDADVQHNLGAIFAIKGMLDEAEKYYRVALRMDPKREATAGSLARVLMQSKKVSDAIVVCKDILRVNPRSVEGHLCLGLAYQAQGMREEAAGEFRTLTMVAPGSDAAWTLLASALREIGKVKEADEALQMAERLRSKSR